MTLLKISHKMIGFNDKSSDPFWYGICSYVREWEIDTDISNHICRHLERRVNNTIDYVIDGINETLYNR